MELISKIQTDPYFNNVLNILSYDRQKPLLVGSASYRQFANSFSDYDLFLIIDRADNNTIYNNIKEILEKAKSSDVLYFIELKVQNKNSKFKFYSEQINKKEFIKVLRNDKDFIKIDFVYRLQDNTLRELSVIYKFRDNLQQAENDVSNAESLKEDAISYANEGEYFKALKRVFMYLYSKYNLQTETASPEINKILTDIINFFNTESGTKYQESGILSALKLLIDNYNLDKNKLLERLITINLINLYGPIKFNKKFIDKKLKENKQFYNRFAEVKYKTIKNSLN